MGTYFVVDFVFFDERLIFSFLFFERSLLLFFFTLLSFTSLSLSSLFTSLSSLFSSLSLFSFHVFSEKNMLEEMIKKVVPICSRFLQIISSSSSPLSPPGLFSLFFLPFFRERKINTQNQSTKRIKKNKESTNKNKIIPY